MRKISRQDFKGLEQSYPVMDNEKMRGIVGGAGLSNTSNGGVQGWGFYDNKGNYFWYSAYDSAYGAYSAYISNGYIDTSNPGYFYLSNGSGGYTSYYNSVYGYSSSSYSSLNYNSNSDIITVDNGRCTLGTIANALSLLGISFDMKEIETYLRPYEAIAALGPLYLGQTSSPYSIVYQTTLDDIYTILSKYFSICYATTVGEVRSELNRGAVAYVELKGNINHTVLITGVDTSKGTFSYSDSVTGKNETISISNMMFDRCIILNRK